MYELIPIVGVLLLSTVIALFLCVLTLRQHSTAGNRYFSAFLFCIAGYSLFIAVELLSTRLEYKILWSKVQYLFVCNMAPFWLLFCLRYVGYDTRLNARRVALVWTLPVVSFLLVLTNEWHHLAWPKVRIVGEGMPGLAEYEHGPATWLVALYSYGMAFTGTGLLLLTALRTSRLFRKQAAALILAMVLPSIGNLLYLSRVYPFQYFDSAPVFFTLAGILLTWAVFRFRLFQFTPIIAEQVLDHMREGLLILDSDQRVLDFNRAAGDLLGLNRGDIGRRVDSALPRLPQLASLPEGSSELLLRAADTPLEDTWVEATVSHLPVAFGRT